MMAVCLSCKQTVLWFHPLAAAGGRFLCSLDKEVGASLAESSQHLLPLGTLSSYPRIGCPRQNPLDGLGAGSWNSRGEAWHFHSHNREKGITFGHCGLSPPMHTRTLVLPLLTERADAAESFTWTSHGKWPCFLLVFQPVAHKVLCLTSSASGSPKHFPCSFHGVEAILPLFETWDCQRVGGQLGIFVFSYFIPWWCFLWRFIQEHRLGCTKGSPVWLNHYLAWSLMSCSFLDLSERTQGNPSSDLWWFHAGTAFVRERFCSECCLFEKVKFTGWPAAARWVTLHLSGCTGWLQQSWIIRK